MSRAQYNMSLEECQRAVQRMDGSFFVPAAVVRFVSVIAPSLTGERFISIMDKNVLRNIKNSIQRTREGKFGICAYMHACK